MEIELIIKIITLVLVLAFFLIRSRFVKHYKKFTWRTSVKWIVLVALFVLYFLSYFDFALLNFNNYIRVIVGGIISLLGFSLLFWSHIHLGKNWSPIIEGKFSKSKKLIRTGPYKYIRHPIYTASFITLLGLFIFSANWILIGIPLLILVVFYSSKIPREERELLDNFGKEYKLYMKTTGGLVPRI